MLYVQQGTLFARHFDPQTRTLSGDPVAVADVGVDPSAALAAVSVSASGTIAYRAGPVGQQRQLTWFDRDGNELRRIGPPEERGGPILYGSLSPDGRRLAVQRRVHDNVDIYLVDLERGTFDRFTTEPQADIAPMWSPSGNSIVYSSQINGIFDLVEKPVTGGEPRVLLQTGEAKQVTDWSRDGRYIIYRSVTMPLAVRRELCVALFKGRADHRDRRAIAVVRHGPDVHVAAWYAAACTIRYAIRTTPLASSKAMQTAS
jgi:hypothetical protein